MVLTFYAVSGEDIAGDDVSVTLINRASLSKQFKAIGLQDLERSGRAGRQRLTFVHIPHRRSFLEDD